MMAKKSTPVAEVAELEELEEVTESTEAEADGMLTAKQAATLIGTDAKTLRKFLRSKQGTVGQGKRWAIDEDEVDQLKADFTAWSTGKAPKVAKAKDKPAAKVEGKAKNKELAAIPDPTEDELEEIDDLDDIEELDD